MKAILASLLVLSASLLLSGCESDMPPAGDHGADKLKRGISGQGALSEPDRSDDPLIHEQTRAGQ